MNPERREKGLRKAKKVLKIWDGNDQNSHYVEEFENRKAHLEMITNRKPCSCYMCGNPRRYFGEITLQERKQRDIEMVQLEEAEEFLKEEKNEKACDHRTLRNRRCRRK